MKRSLPIGFGLGFGTFWGCQKGVLKVNISTILANSIFFHLRFAIKMLKLFILRLQTGKYGAWPKIIGASVLGYIIGRFSYMKTCQEKIMELPNSRLAQMLRNRSRKYNPTLAEESYATDAGFATALTLAPLQTEDYSQSLNLDTNRPDDAGDQYEPTQQGINDLNEDLNIPTRKNFVSYDELRQKNRDDFNKSHRFAPGPRLGCHSTELMIYILKFICPFLCRFEVIFDHQHQQQHHHRLPTILGLHQMFQCNRLQ